MTGTRDDVELGVVQRGLDRFDRLVMYRYPHVAGPIALAGAAVGVTAAVDAVAEHGVRAAGYQLVSPLPWLPWLLTVAAAVVVLLGLESVGHLPGPREKWWAAGMWLGGGAWAVAAGWWGPFAGVLPWAWTALLLVGWPPWFKHRRVRRAVEVSAEIAAWDGDAVGLAGVELVQSGSGADGHSWWARLRPQVKGSYTLAKLRQAIPRIAARYDASIGDVAIEPVRDGKEGEYLLRVQTKSRERAGVEYVAPQERPSLREPFQIGVLADRVKPLLCEVWRRGHGGVDGLTAGAKGGGKALALDTPVPTPTGWTTMGELRDGDTVLDEAGQTCRVVVAHAVRHDRPCYRVTFADGETIVADAEHNWWTENLAERSCYRAGGVRTTEQIAASVRVRDHYNHAVPVAAALSLPAVDLPIPPYVLGVWLGDGTSSAAALTCADDEIPQHVLAEGEPIVRRPRSGPYAWAFTDGIQHARGGPAAGTLRSRLARLAVLNDKHIPMTYLRSSAEQRRALLAGLLDTDGTISRGGQVQFAVCNERLARDVRELVASLGYRPCFRARPAKLNGRTVGTSWLVGFSTADPVFRLTRKREAQAQRTARHVPARSYRRAIVAVEPISSVPVRCITVDSPSRLYLVGRTMIPTHNTSYYRQMAARAIAAHDGLVIICDLKPGSPDYRQLGTRGAYVYATTGEQVDMVIAALLTLCEVRGRTPRPDRQVVLVLVDETAFYFAPSAPEPVDPAETDLDRRDRLARRARNAAAQVDQQRLANWDRMIAVCRAFDIAVHAATQRGRAAKLGGADTRAALVAGQACGFYSALDADSALLSGEREFDLTSLPKGVPGECLMANSIHDDVVRGTQYHLTDDAAEVVLDRFAIGQGDLHDDELDALRSQFGARWDNLRASNRVRSAPMVVEAEPEPSPPTPGRMTREQSLQAVWDALAACPKPVLARDVATAVGKSERIVRERLGELVAAGRATEEGRGARYRKYAAVHP